MKFIQASTLVAILAVAAANPVPEDSVQAPAVVERSVQDNVQAPAVVERSVQDIARGITSPIENREVAISRRSDALQNFTLSRTIKNVQTIVGGVLFKFAYESATKFTVTIASSLDRSINVFVKSLETHIDVVGQALAGGGSATDEGVPLQLGDTVQLSWSYV